MLYFCIQHEKKLLDDFEKLGFTGNSYNLLAIFSKNLSWCKLWHLKEDSPIDIIENLKIKYLGMLSERLENQTENYEFEKNELLSTVSELFMYHTNEIKYYSLINLYPDKGNKKYLSTKKLSHLSEENQNSPQNLFLIKMLLFERASANDHYNSAINKLEKIIDLVKSKPEIGVKIEMLKFCLGTVFFERSLCRKRSEIEKLDDSKKAIEYIKEYYELRKEANPCEANYNLGRAYHCIGKLKEAEKYYLKGLSIYSSRKMLSKISGINENEQIESEDNYEQEIAYNLAHIYEYCGNLQMAQNILLNYVKF